MLLLFCVHNYTWTTTTRTITIKQYSNNKKHDYKKIHVNWSFCSDATCCSYSYYCVMLLLCICNCEMHNEGWTATTWHSGNNTYMEKMKCMSRSSLPPSNWPQIYGTPLHWIFGSWWHEVLPPLQLTIGIWNSTTPNKFTPQYWHLVTQSRIHMFRWSVHADQVYPPSNGP